MNRSRRLEQLAVTIHDRLSNHTSIDPADLVVAGCVLLGPDHPHVLALVETFGLEAAKTRVLFNHPSGRREILVSASNVLLRRHPNSPEPLPITRIKVEDMEVGADGMLPAGKYEVAVVSRGMDNVVVEIEAPHSLDDIEEIAKTLWADGDTVDMGNEWQEPESYTVKPIDDPTLE